MKADERYRLAAEQFGTPYYLFLIKELHERIGKIKNILGSGIQLCYAVKANPFLVSYLDAFVDKFEVCSPGEYEICKKEKIDSSKIILSGVYKEKNDLVKTFEDGFQGTYTLESKNQCELLYGLAKKNEKQLRILIRMTSGNQFGMDREDIENIVRDSEYNRYFRIEGVHYYSGTQKRNHAVIEQEINEIAAFCSRMQEYGGAFKKIEYGPGLYVDYFGGGIESLDEIAFLSEQLESVSKQMEITVELGRYITALCGKYVTQIVDVKKNQGINYAITDGGIHQTGYHGQMLGMKNPRVTVIHNETEETFEREKWMVCGALCTVQDVLLKNYEMEKPKEGDLLVFHDTGAYAMTDTNMMFLSREFPIVLTENVDGTTECIRERIESSRFNSKGGKERL